MTAINSYVLDHVTGNIALSIISLWLILYFAEIHDFILSLYPRYLCYM